MNRAPRDLDTREEEGREETWAPPSVLPEPAPEDGWAFRWIARIVGGSEDVMNMSKRRREGWEPVTPSEQPHMADFSDATGHIEVGGLVLCKMPRSKANARKKYYEDLAEAQVTGLSRQFRKEAAEDPRMSIFEERKSKVTKNIIE